MVANLVLSRAGLKASDVSFVGVGTSAGALAALRSGQIDAMSNTDPVISFDPAIKADRDRPGQDLHQRICAPGERKIQSLSFANV
jgi:hypothetical protein